jgi:multidrug resistance protein MdtO
MQAVFSRNLERLAQLADQLANPDRDQSLRSIRRLRDQINAGFSEVNAQADAVLFEFGPSRRRKMKIRDDIKRWQPSLRTLLLVEITSWQYQLQAPLNELPEPVAQAFIAFEKDTASMLRVIADEVNGQVAEPAPKIQESATKLQQEIGMYYTERGLPLPPRSSDVIRLTQTIASILAPLFADVHSTFVNSQQAVGGQPQTRMGEA